METKIETIRQKCIEANPSILDLKFGCVLKTPFDNVIYVDNYGKTEWKEADIITYLEKGELMKKDISEKGFEYFFEIIGRPIRLADVLLAIQKYSKKGIYFRADGVFFEWEKFTDGGNGHHGVFSIYKEWNLLEDDLTKQSPETINYLYNLIK